MAGSGSFRVCQPTISCCTGPYDSDQFVVDIHVDIVTIDIVAISSVTFTVLWSVKFGLFNAHSVGNKATNIAAVIDEGCYDVFLLTETWHTASEDIPLRRCIPSGYIFFDAPRSTTGSGAKTNHGGIAVIISDRLKCKLGLGVSWCLYHSAPKRLSRYVSRWPAPHPQLWSCSSTDLGLWLRISSSLRSWHRISGSDTVQVSSYHCGRFQHSHREIN